MTTYDHEHILAGVRRERIAQDEKWGVQRHRPEVWLAILSEEVGEFATEVLNYDRANMRKELMQVAAVAVAAIESIDAS